MTTSHHKQNKSTYTWGYSRTLIDSDSTICCMCTTVSS